MSYGSNAPQGLAPVNTVANATWNGAVSPYLLASGYAQNVFKGDPVFLTGAADTAFAFGSGYVASLYSRNMNTYNIHPTLGSADGFSFAVPPSVQPIDNASRGRSYWAANTVTIGGVPAVASLINDPNVIYEIQTTSTNGEGATQALCGFFAQFLFSVTGGLVDGNLYTGQSMVALAIDASGGNAPSNATPTYNFFINNLSNNPKNVSGVQYNNVQGLIANHYFRVMPSNASTPTP